MGSHRLFTALIVATLALSQLDSCLAIQCYSCNSTDSQNCITDPAGQTTVDCQTDCYTSADAGTIARGCLATGTACTDPLCNSCNTDKCNTNLVCKQCLGLSECGQTDVTNASYNAICSADQYCVNQVNTDQTVTRKCGSQCAADSKPESCTSCQTALCNQGIYPTDRIQCYSCTGETCNTPANSSLTACGLVDAQCYMIGTSATTMIRGCTSDSEAKCQVGSTESSCAICNTTGCNGLPYERPADTCIVCTGCEVAQNAATAQSCGTLSYNQAALGCYTQNNGNAVTRGCLTTEMGVCSAEKGCTQCSEAACNVAAESVEFQCAQCSTLTDTTCQKGAEAPATNCSSQECFSGYWNGAGIRGCFDQASELMQYQCVHQESHQCTICKTSLCNKVEFSGAESGRKLGLLGLLMGLVLALRHAL